MDETDLIITLRDHLDAALSAPIRTSGMEDDRPVPSVIIDDWDTKDLNHNNSALAGEFLGDVDSDGTKEYERYLNFSFRTRVELLFKHSDEVDVSRLKERAKHELRMIGENPQNFHDDLKECNLAADGNPTYEFVEPKEAELMLSARFRGDHTITLTPADMDIEPIEIIKNDFHDDLDSEDFTTI